MREPADSPPHVLVVDDDPAMRTLVELVLVQSGYQVTAAASAEEASALLHCGGHDAIVTDLQLPAMSGFELVDLARERAPGTPAMILTAARGRGAGPVAARVGVPVMCKPFSVDDLVARVDDLVGGRAPRTSAPPPDRAA